MRSVMGRLSATLPWSCLALAKGCVLPRSVVSWDSSMRLMMRTVGATPCPWERAGKTKALANMHSGMQRVMRRGSERSLIIEVGPGPFLEKDPQMGEELPCEREKPAQGRIGLRSLDGLETKPSYGGDQGLTAATARPTLSPPKNGRKDGATGRMQEPAPASAARLGTDDRDCDEDLETMHPL